MTIADLTALIRDEPGAALACLVAPVLVAVAQLANALYHDVSVLYPGLFAAALLAFAVLATQYRLAARRVTLAWSSVEQSVD